MIGKKIIELARVDSTNAYANQVFPGAEFENGTVIWAHEQFAGRGQHDHRWISEACKNLTITVCLKPRFLAPGRQFQLNKAIALGIIDFIDSFLQPASPGLQPASSIKWPNDIYIGNRKIGGILIENRIMGSSLETSFAGIGINVNQTRFTSDIPNPVSLIQILGRETELKASLLTLCGFLDMRYQELRQKDPVSLDQEFDRSLLGFDQWGNFVCHGARLEGKIKGVDNSGRLLLETHNSEILSFDHQEITYLL
jgi:BirA family biotin operon repressor/biotin-[acetyl-CoA-carboxylase] ligase